MAAAVALAWPAHDRVLSGSDCIALAHESASVSDGCASVAEVMLGNDRIALGAGTRIERTPAGLRLIHGEVELTVAKRAPGDAPFHLRVSHGTIIVLGTMFRARQGTGEGEVSLVEGRIAFAWDDGARQTLAPGDRLVWPRPPPAAEEPEAAPPPKRVVRKPRPAPAPKPESRDVMEELSQLRGQRRYREAADLLREILARRDLDPAIAERLSFERAEILEHQLDDHAGACEQWRTHAARFPSPTFMTRRVIRALAPCR